MFKKSVLLLIPCLILGFASSVQATDRQSPGGPYLGQTPPGDEATLFAPGIISGGFNDRDMAMMPDGSEIYFSVNMRHFEISTILVVYKVNNSWSKPAVAPFAVESHLKYLEPAISPDGSKFFFVASEHDGKNNNDIWMMNREADGWGKPVKLGENIYPEFTTALKMATLISIGLMPG